MTAGDIYSDYDVSTGTGGTNIIPAGTTKVLITAIYTDDASNGRFTLQMNEVYASPGIGDSIAVLVSSAGIELQKIALISAHLAQLHNTPGLGEENSA